MVMVTDDAHGSGSFVSQNISITVQLEEPSVIPDEIGGEAGSVVIETELVNPDNIEEGLLPSIYEGLLRFFSWVFIPFVSILVGILIILTGVMLVKKAKRL
jgi:hypothetical protein